MNERIKQILLQVVPMAGEEGEYLPSLHTPEDIEKFAELLLTNAFTIIREAMIDSESEEKVDEVIADRLDDAAYDVCDQLGLMGPIFEG